RAIARIRASTSEYSVSSPSKSTTGGSGSDQHEEVKANRESWAKNNAANADGRAEHAWNEQEITWGVWSTPESEVKVLPDVRGKDVIELGCGTAYVSAWLKRAGARRVVGVDITPAQLETARRMNAKSGLGLELIEIGRAHV